jgi:hypothetical protein
MSVTLHRLNVFVRILVRFSFRLHTHTHLHQKYPSCFYQTHTVQHLDIISVLFIHQLIN